MPSAVKSSGILAGANFSNLWFFLGERDIMFSSRSLWSQTKWETGVLRHAFFSPMEYVVLATDYTSKALVCSCQDLSVAGFGGLNRRSCDFLVVSAWSRIRSR